MTVFTTRNDAMPDVTTPMRAPWSEIAPHLTEISNAVLFDDIWRRPGLSPRDRSLITVASLIALYRSNELKFHLGKALEKALVRTELTQHNLPADCSNDRADECSTWTNSSKA